MLSQDALSGTDSGPSKPLSVLRAFRHRRKHLIAFCGWCKRIDHSSSSPSSRPPQDSIPHSGLSKSSAILNAAGTCNSSCIEGLGQPAIDTGASPTSRRLKTSHETLRLRAAPRLFVSLYFHRTHATFHILARMSDLSLRMSLTQQLKPTRGFLSRLSILSPR